MNDLTTNPGIENFNSMKHEHFEDIFVSMEPSNTIENFVSTVVNRDLTTNQFPMSQMTSDFEYCYECNGGIDNSLLFSNPISNFMTFKTAVIDLAKKVKEGNPFGLEVSSPKDYPVVIQGNCYFEEGFLLFEVLYFKDQENDIGSRDLFKVDEQLFFTYYDVFVNEVAVQNSLSISEGV